MMVLLCILRSLCYPCPLFMMVVVHSLALGAWLVADIMKSVMPLVTLLLWVSLLLQRNLLCMVVWMVLIDC